MDIYNYRRYVDDTLCSHLLRKDLIGRTKISILAFVADWIPHNRHPISMLHLMACCSAGRQLRDKNGGVYWHVNPYHIDYRRDNGFRFVAGVSPEAD